jgi:D-3-phosphoglycerate dehydrogenase / 2-oxoglutarate reductase
LNLPVTVLFLDSVHPILEQNLKLKNFICIHDYNCSPQELINKYQNIDGIVIRSRFKMNHEVLSSLKNLKFIARFGAGMENIDLEFAEKCAIHCLHAPEGNMDAVGEHAIGMLLSLFNHLNRADAQVRKGLWYREENRGIELSGKTVGVIGYGNMGKSFVKKLHGFDVNILVNDIYKTNFLEQGINAQEVEIEKIFEEADIVSMHINYNLMNHYFANKIFFEKFLKPIYIINTSRGKVLNCSDLLDAINSKIVLGACLDVLEFESISFENIANAPEVLKELFKKENVVFSPHIAGWSKESFEKMGVILSKKILNLLSTN